MEKRIRYPSLVGTVCLLIVLSLMTGCYRPAAPDVTAIPAEVTPSEEDIAATAAAESTRVAQEETAAAETPTVSPPTATPTTAPATPVPTTPPTTQVTPAPTSTPLPTGQVTHVVKRGENLFRIALRYGTTVQAIASANGIANPALIYTGQTLVIPSPGGQPPPPVTDETTYVVQPGDNLFRIALRYDMNYLHLAQYNGIANPSRIYVGQVLRIP
jgi:LysM repeat protein